MLKQLSKSKNETISSMANDMKETLLLHGSPTQRVANFLEIKKPTGKDFKIVRSAFEEYGRDKMRNLGNGVSNKAKLFANYTTQSDEIFRQVIGTKNYLNNAYYDFNTKAGLNTLPVKEIWQPRTEFLPDTKSGFIERIFNVKPQHHLHKPTDYLIDLGDGKQPKVVDEVTLKKVLQAKENLKAPEKIEVPIGPEPIDIKQPEPISNFNIEEQKNAAKSAFMDLDKGVEASDALIDKSIPFDKKIELLKQSIGDKQVLKTKGYTFYRKGEDIFLVVGNKMRKLKPNMFNQKN